MKNLNIAAGYGKQLERVYPELAGWRSENSTIVLMGVEQQVSFTNDTEMNGRTIADQVYNAIQHYKRIGQEATNEKIIDFVVGYFNSEF